jgi:hypothetical protein
MIGPNTRAHGCLVLGKAMLGSTVHGCMDQAKQTAVLFGDSLLWRSQSMHKYLRAPGATQLASRLRRLQLRLPAAGLLSMSTVKSVLAHQQSTFQLRLV